MRALWPDKTITHLEPGEVTHLSLDHDLGNNARGTGYDVLLWFEEAVALCGFKPPEIRIHSANASAHHKMEMAARSIERLTSQSD